MDRSVIDKTIHIIVVEPFVSWNSSVSPKVATGANAEMQNDTE